MKRPFQSLSAACLAASLFAAVSPALAEPDHNAAERVAAVEGADPLTATPVQLEQAQQRFVRGKALFEENRPLEALAEFSASRAIVASPNTRLYQARCLAQLERLLEAYVEYDRALVHGRELAKHDVRYARTASAAAAERQELQSRLGFVRISVQHALPQTKLLVNGEEIRRPAWSETIPVQPGSVNIQLLSPGSQPQRREIEIQAGETPELSLDVAESKRLVVAAVAVPIAPASEQPSPATEGQSSGWKAPVMIASAGVGVAGFAAFGVLGYFSRQNYTELRSACAEGLCPESERSRLERGQREQTWANIGLVVGAVGAAATLGVWLLAPSGEAEKPALALVVNPMGLGLKGQL